MHSGDARRARPTGVRTRLRTVLDLVSVSSGPSYAADFTPAEGSAYGLADISVAYDTWHEMGRPKQITVTIEPGDRHGPVPKP